MTDREQTRRDAEEWIREFGDDPDGAGRLARYVLALLAELEQAERERDGAQLALESNSPLILDLQARLAKVRPLVEALRRTVNVGEHLLEMIPQQTWRDEGGDDGQGHYEGEYHQARIAEGFKECHAALAAWENMSPDG